MLVQFTSVYVKLGHVMSHYVRVRQVWSGYVSSVMLYQVMHG